MARLIAFDRCRWEAGHQWFYAFRCRTLVGPNAVGASAQHGLQADLATALGANGRRVLFDSTGFHHLPGVRFTAALFESRHDYGPDAARHTQLPLRREPGHGRSGPPGSCSHCRTGRRTKGTISCRNPDTGPLEARFACRPYYNSPAWSMVFQDSPWTICSIPFLACRQFIPDTAEA